MKIDNLESKKQFYLKLDERHRRHFAAIEAMGLGHGGIKVVSEAFSTSVVTIRKGINQIKTRDQITEGRIRQEGGGRKKTFNIT